MEIDSCTSRRCARGWVSLLLRNSRGARVGGVRVGGVRGEAETSTVEHEAVARLRARDWTDDEFRRYLTTHGTPLCRRVGSETEAGAVVGPRMGADERLRAGLVAVTFVLEVDDEEAAAAEPVIELVSLIDRAIRVPRHLARVPGSSFSALTLALPSDLRFTYGFTVMRNGQQERKDGPFNPSRGGRDA